MLKVLELFAGIGACSKALENLGIEHEIVDAVEIDKYAVKSFNAIHGTNFEPQDITKWDKDIECDLIMHGSPCQDFSVAGKNAGGDKDSGTRSSLMYETLRIVEKLRPKYVIWENVKNLLSKKHRHNFDAYLDAMTDLGYANNYQVLNAKDYGVPQNRERVFTVSIRKDIYKGYFFPAPIPLEKKLKDVLEDDVDEKYYLKKTDNIVFSAARAYWDNSGKGYGSQEDRAVYQDGVAPTLSRCNESGDKAQVVLGDAGWIDNVVSMVNKNAKHQQDLVQSEDGICRVIPAGTHGSTPHLLKTLVEQKTKPGGVSKSLPLRRSVYQYRQQARNSTAADYTNLNKF